MAWYKLVVQHFLVAYVNNSLHLARKYARIFVRGHYLFRKASSFLRDGSSRKTVCFEEQIMSKDKYTVHIYAPNEGYCVYYASNIFRNTRSYENWGISSDIPQF